MRRLTNDKSTLHKILQSLPLALAAIVFVLYGATFLPSSTKGMESCVALVEGMSYYEISADGRPVAIFSSLDDSLRPHGLALPADSVAATKRYANGCWVNKYPFITSCGGMILVANDDSMAEKRLLPAERQLPSIIDKAAERLSGRIIQLERKTAEIDYYMKVHNVNDDGYNVMAEYSASVKAERETANKLLTALGRASAARRLAIRRVTKYALLSPDSAGNTARTQCAIISPCRTSRFILLQTDGGYMPDGAKAVYPHLLLTPSFTQGDSLVIASYPGCTAYRFNPANARPATFGAAAKADGNHDLPPLLAPDGSAVFSAGGRFAGISSGGTIVKPSFFGFGLKELLK